MDVIRHRIDQFPHAFQDGLGVFVERGSYITVAQVCLYVFRIPEALGVRCKRASQLVAEFQNWQTKEKPRSFARITKQEELNEALARRGWIIRSTQEAIAEIGKQSAYLGAHFQRSSRADNGRFVLALESDWIVD